MGLAQTQDMDKDMDRTVGWGGVGWGDLGWGDLGWGGGSRWGWAFLFLYTIPFA